MKHAKTDPRAGRALPLLLFTWTCVILLTLTATPSVAKDRPNPGGDGKPPKGAIVLFDGQDLSKWTRDDGQPAAWKVDNGTAVITPGSGNIVSKLRFTDALIHLEFNLPEGGKQHGNSGVYLHQLYEVQIIDSYNKNPYEPGQQCAALYQVFPATNNVCKKPGQWQTYDIVLHGARLDSSGKLVKPARVSLWHNGVLVQDDRPLSKGTGGAKGRKLVGKGPILLQNHGAPVRFRNIWVKVIQ